MILLKRLQVQDCGRSQSIEWSLKLLMPWPRPFHALLCQPTLAQPPTATNGVNKTTIFSGQSLLCQLAYQPHVLGIDTPWKQSSTVTEGNMSDTALRGHPRASAPLRMVVAGGTTHHWLPSLPRLPLMPPTGAFLGSSPQYTTHPGILLAGSASKLKQKA